MSNADYLDAVGKDTFLAAYLDWNSPLETPVGYDFWCGMWLLSCAVGRDLYVRRPHAPVYLNLYAVLCSDAGVTRKSTAIRRAETLYYATSMDQHYATVTASVSPEQLFSRLATQSEQRGVGAGAIIVSELITVLGREQYSMGMPGLLTDLYDCPSIRTRQRVSTGEAAIRNAYVTFLAASTPTWLVRAINPDVIEGGFTSRTLFVIEDKPKRRVAWPDEADDSSRLPDLVSRLTAVGKQAQRNAESGITLTPAARTRFTRWYDSRSAGDGVFLHSFEAREDHHVLRVAALLCVNDGTYMVQPRHIDHAIRIITRVKSGAAGLFGEANTNKRIVVAVDRLRDKLADAGVVGINKTDLIFKCRTFLKAAELDYALTVMHELGMADRFDIQGKRGAPKTVWRATNTITRRDTVLLLNERLAD
jgi:hypothetical protein